MPRGLPASYIKKAKRELGKGASWHDVFKRAWELYKGSKVYKAVSGNPTSKRGSRKKSSKKRSVSRMPKKKRRYRRTLTIPLAPLMGIIPMVDEAVNSAMKGDWNMALRHLQWHVLGIDSTGKFHIDKAISNFIPLVIGLLIHKFVGGSPLNLNRTLARHKIPLIRI